jgi:uncharacterized damage-inducible protein DinB
VIGYLNKLVEHLAWADESALSALRNAPGSESRGLTFYAHILGAEATWLARIAGRRSDVAIWPTLSLDEAATLAARNAAELRALIAPLTADDLAAEVQYHNSAGKEFRSTLEDILLHVALHGAYHRGQVSLLIRDGRGEPIATDYIAFIRGAPAARTVPPAPATQPR